MVWDKGVLDRRAGSVSQPSVKFSQAVRDFCHLAAAGGSWASRDRGLGWHRHRFPWKPSGTAGKGSGEKGDANAEAPGRGLVRGK